MTIALVAIAVLAVVLLGAAGLIMRVTQRLPAGERLHQDPAGIAAPLSLEIAARDSAPVERRDRVA